MKTQAPPRDNLYRAVFPGLELRADSEDSQPVMTGHFARFDEWTEINSVFEGRFLERFMPGAFKKTISESRDSMRVLFQHGYDPSVGDKPLGPIRELREDDEGAYYEVPLLDAAYVRNDVLPGLEAGLYGASFRFRVIREEWDQEPEASDRNPDGLPERTVKEAEVREFGPVTFPAYAGATAGIRSLSDEFVLSRFAEKPERLREILTVLEERSDEHEDDTETSAPPDDGAEEAHSEDGRRDKPEPLYGTPADKQTPNWRL